jgi:hypothetical protein
MLMKKEFSIVKVDKRNHRTIAQENWGLTSEQMKGMHVHHRIPRSQGGSNDPSNLFVCSPHFHAYVWHDKCHYTMNAIKGCKASAAARQMLRETNPEWRAREVEYARRGGIALHKKRKIDPDLDKSTESIPQGVESRA